MDSLDPMQEINRNASCADELYSLIWPASFPLNSEEEVDAWAYTICDVIEKHNVTILIPLVKRIQCKLKTQLGDQNGQDILLNELHEQVREIIDRRKSDIAALHFSNQDTINKPPFRIERGGTGDKIFIDDCLIIYDKEKNDNKENRQWLPLMVAFINSNRYQLLETSIAEAAHTSCGDALNRCVSKTNKILRQNYQFYKEQGKTIHLVSIEKERNAPTRRLCIKE